MYKKKRKVQRLRGSKTHGWGAMKKHRGAGHRGGRGNAGSGKRGDAKKPSVWRNAKKKGFVSVMRVMKKTVNVGDLAKLQGKEEKDVLVIDLTAQGIKKLLGSGSVNHKYKVIVEEATERALKKIQEAGGTVVLPSTETSEVAVNEETA